MRQASGATASAGVEGAPSEEPERATRRPSNMRRSFVVLLLVTIAACSTSPAASPYQISGQAVAGPTCPVEPASPVPGQCAPRPVAGAVLVITDSAGREVTRATTGADGRWAASVPAGTETITPQPVQGLLGTARPISIIVAAGSVPTMIQIDYDTGIR
jgi:hypothetical protein